MITINWRLKVILNTCKNKCPGWRKEWREGENKAKAFIDSKLGW